MRGGVIVAVGGMDAVEQFLGPDTGVRDFAGFLCGQLLGRVERYKVSDLDHHATSSLPSTSTFLGFHLPSSASALAKEWACCMFIQLSGVRPNELDSL